eukprot:gene1160-1731_t
MSHDYDNVGWTGQVRVHNVSKEKCTTFRCHCNRVKKMVVEPDNPHAHCTSGILLLEGAASATTERAAAQLGRAERLAQSSELEDPLEVSEDEGAAAEELRAAASKLYEQALVAAASTSLTCRVLCQEPHKTSMALAAVEEGRVGHLSVAGPVLVAVLEEEASDPEESEMQAEEDEEEEEEEEPTIAGLPNEVFVEALDAEVAVESGVDRGRANYQVGRALVLLGRHEEALQAVDAAYEVSWSEELEALRASLHEHLNIAVEHDAGHGSDRDEDAASEDPPGGCGEEGAGQMEADEGEIYDSAGAAEGGVGTEEESGALGDTEATGADSELEASSEDNEEAELEAGSRQRRSRPTSRQHSIFNRVFGSEVDDGEEEDTDDDMDTDDDSLITDDILMNSSEDEVRAGQAFQGLPPSEVKTVPALPLVKTVPVLPQGHRNMRTVKDVSFLGPHEEYVASGSDNGAMLIWCRYSGRLLFQYKGDSEVVNCIQAHPIDPVIASCG